MASQDAGFSLLEALVALAILAIALTSLILVFGSSYERITVETARMRGLIEAQSILERVGLDIPSTVQQDTGLLADGSRWDLSVAPYEEAPGLGPMPGLLDVTVKVAPRAGARAVVELRTLRLMEVAR